MDEGVSMKMYEYQAEAMKTAIYPTDDDRLKLSYLALGLVGEAGEVANTWKKVIRDDTPDYADKLADEMGDVLWYLANLADAIGYPLDVIADRNLNKLRSRQERGVLSGSGDNR